MADWDVIEEAPAPDFSGVRGAVRGGGHGMREPGNIDLRTRPVVKNPDGTISTVRSMSANFDGQEVLIEGAEDAHPLLSRCIPLPLSRRGITESFAARAKEIASQVGLDGRPIEAYERRFKDRRNNFRAVLCDIEAGAMLSE